MYYASANPRLPKRKIVATVTTSEGDELDGHFFASGDQRLKDLLNGECDFLPFETLGGAMHILNRKMLARVTPRLEAVPEFGPREVDSAVARFQQVS